MGPVQWVRAVCSKRLAASEAVILPALIFSMARRVSAAAPKRRASEAVWMFDNNIITASVADFLMEK
jgi:hypothetical protein